jgi:hypothetical protein
MHEKLEKGRGLPVTILKNPIGTGEFQVCM